MENQKTKIISIASIIALALTLVTATFAYFMSQTGEGKSTDIKINANTVDTITFEAGSALNLSLNQENFASGKGNQTGTTVAKAMLTANNKTNTATEHYYLYLNISNNTFTYSIDNNTPEILLSIKDGSNNEITTLTGLTYKTVTDGKGASIKGFDITTKKGLVTILNNREITTTSTKTEQWNVTVTFVNYNANQAGNAGKNFSAKLMIQKEEFKESVATVCSNGQTLSSCIMAMDGKDDTLYHHTSSLANGAGDNSYRYAGGDYVLTDAGEATGATMMIGYNNSVTTALIDFYCNGTKQYVGYGCSSSQTHYYLIKGETTQYQTYNEALNVAVEKGYLTKDNVKNFVCFGSEASTCPTENLYRIIGVFNNQVKLIKYDYAKSSLLGTDGDYSTESTSNYFSGKQGESPSSNSIYYLNYKADTANYNNTWSNSLLNKTNLNTNFINNIGTTWANKIVTTTWKVGGNVDSNIVVSVPKTAYQNEIVNPVIRNTTDNKTEYSAKIGLMYVSDYYYGASPSAWTLVGYNSDYSKSYASAKGENWLYGGGCDWTITRDSGGSNRAFYVSDYGYVRNVFVSNGYGVRPSFSLESSTTYVSGSGSASDPIVIN